MNKTLSQLHPVRLLQINPTFKRRCKEALNWKTVATLDVKDGASLMALSVPWEFFLWKSMSFEQLQGLIARANRDQYEALLFSKFWYGARQIFQFTPELAAMLAKTELGDVPWDALRVPCQMFYIHFGCILESELELNGRTYKAEGAYVRIQDGTSAINDFLSGAVHIAIASRLVRPTHAEVLGQFGAKCSLNEPIYDITISGTAGEIMEEVLARGREGNLGLARELDEDSLCNAIRVARHYGLSVPDNPVSIQYAEKRYLRGEALTREAVKLVLNCIIYLTAVPQEMPEEYPTEAPRGLLQRIEQATSPTKREKLVQNMNELGFTKVHSVQHQSPLWRIWPGSKTARLRAINLLAASRLLRREINERHTETE